MNIIYSFRGGGIYASCGFFSHGCKGGRTLYMTVNVWAECNFSGITAEPVMLSCLIDGSSGMRGRKTAKCIIMFVKHNIKV